MLKIKHSNKKNLLEEEIFEGKKEEILYPDIASISKSSKIKNEV